MSLFGNLKSFSSNIAVIDENSNRYTYGDLLKNTNYINKNFNSRDTIFLVSENSYEFLCCYVALVINKSVIYQIEKTLKEKKLNNLINIYKPNYILSPIKIPFKNAKEILNLNNRYNLFKTNFKNNYKVYKDLAVLLSTSGSTGSPKFVKLSYLNLIDNTRKISNYLKIKSKHKVITTMQPSYSYGLSILNSHLIKGASIIMTDKTLFEKSFWNLIIKHKATTFGGVPFIFKILKRINFENMKLPSLEYLTQAGGKLELNVLKEIIQMFKRKNLKLIIMYGQTEASPRMSYLPWKYLLKKMESIGKPLKGGKFFIYDKNKKIIDKNNAIGELAYKGKNVMIGYAENFKELHNTKKDNLLFTGDLAYRDKDGFYYIVGRKSRFIKLFGLRYSLDDIEKEINKYFNDCAVIGTDDSLKIFIIKNCKHDNLYEFLFKNFKIRKSVLSIEKISKIPRNKSGKIIYSQLNHV